MATVWKGQLEFGLVGCPVRMEKVHRDVEEAPASHMAHKDCGSKIERPWHCPSCEKQVEYADLVRVFEDGDGNGNGVALTQEEFKGARIDEKKLVIEQFVEAASLDPVYLSGMAYWMHLDMGKKKNASKTGLFAWSALVQNMIEMGVVAIASWASRGKDYIVILRPYSGSKGRTLIAQVMEYGEVIEVDCTELQDVSETVETDLLKKLIGQYNRPFDAGKYESDYAKKLRSMLAEKAEGGEVQTISEAEDSPDTDDLIRKLKASLDQDAA